MAREGSAWASSEIGKSFTGWAFARPEAFGQYEAALSLGLHCRWACTVAGPALSLGLMERDALMELVGPAARRALATAATDQTRTVGLVTLPGAFVGALIGSGNPVQAGAAQFLVLIGLLAARRSLPS